MCVFVIFFAQLLVICIIKMTRLLMPRSFRVVIAAFLVADFFVIVFRRGAILGAIKSIGYAAILKKAHKVHGMSSHAAAPPATHIFFVYSKVSPGEC